MVGDSPAGIADYAGAAALKNFSLTGIVSEN